MSLSPQNSVPPLHRWYAWIVLFLILTATTTVIGLRLATYIALKTGNRPVAMTIHATPEAKIPEAWKTLIAGAQREVFLSSGLLSSETLALELDAAAQRGVAVVLILPLTAYPDSTPGLRRWLAEKHSRIEVVLDPVSFTGTTCVIDNRVALITSQPLAATDTLAHLGGFFASFTDPAAIQGILLQMRAQVARAQKQ